MIDQNITVSQIGFRPIRIGYAGDNEHTVVKIDCSEVFADYPNAEVQLIVDPVNGDSYPPEITVSNGIVQWEITASDTRSAGGGEYQLVFTSGETEVFHSDVGKYLIAYSLDIDGEIPDPIESWILRAEQTAKEIAIEAAQEVGILADFVQISGTDYRIEF